MKTVEVYPEVAAPGGNENETLIDPAIDILEVDEDEEFESFNVGDIVAVKIHDQPFKTRGKVTKVHLDEFGVLVQIHVYWGETAPTA